MGTQSFSYHYVLLLILLSSVSFINGEEDATKTMEHLETFANLAQANTSESFEIISQLKLKKYQYKFDTVAGRNHLGVIGPEIESLVPDGLKVFPTHAVMDPSSPGKSITLKNYYVVDKNALFMHNVAATQHLMELQDHSSRKIQNLDDVVATQYQMLDKLQEHLDQEASASLVEKRKISEAQSETKRLEIIVEETRGKEDRASLDHKFEIEKEIETVRDAFAERRLAAEDESRKAQNREFVQLQEESNVRVEMKRRETEIELKTIQIEADRDHYELESNTTLEKARIDVEGRIRQQRLNEDIDTRQAEASHKAEMERIIRAIQVTFDNIGSGFISLVTNRDRLIWFIGSFVTLAAGIYIAREAVRVTGRYIEQHLGKPSLVRETSRRTGLFGFISGCWKKPYGEDELNDVVLDSDLQVRILEVSRATKNSQRHAAPYRHLLLYGPPGTGKTMVAKRLARCSGLDYAIMSGGDVGPLGSDAVTELHAIFRWANASPRGVLLFIDEAEAFLGCRARTDMSESMRNALNALLYQTGEQSQKFMMVIATNRPEDLDSAVTDRIDETLHFALPGTSERLGMLKMYFKRYITEAHLTRNELGRRKEKHVGRYVKDWFMSLFVKTMEGIEVKDITEKHISAACDKTKGMSGREISKLMLYLQSVVYGQDTRVANAKLFNRVVDDKVKEHKRKKELLKKTISS